jgi:hypothetical protein
MGDMNGKPFIALEYIDGGTTFAELISKLPRRELITVMRDVDVTWSLEHGDPTQAIAEARRWLAKSLELNPRWDPALVALGRLEILAGRWEAKEGRSPASCYAQARAVSQAALKLSPKNAQPMVDLAESHRRLAEWKRAAHEATASDVAAGLEYVKQALAIDPKNLTAITEKNALDRLK